MKPIPEFDRSDDTDFEPEIAQQATDVVLNCNRLLLQQLARGQQGTALRTGQRLDV